MAVLYFFERNDFMTKQICTECRTGMLDYMIDTKSSICSYIACLNDEGCGMFIPLKDSETPKSELPEQ